VWHDDSCPSKKINTEPAVEKYIALKEFLEVTSFKGARKPEGYKKKKALWDGGRVINHD